MNALANWDALIADFLEATFAARPDVAVWAGRHEFDGRLPDWSREGLAHERARLEAWRALAERIDPAPLDAARRFEREHLLAVIDGEVFWLARADWPHRSPTYYSGALDPDVYVTRAYAPLADRLRAYTAYARAVPTAVAQIRANLRAPMPRTYIDRGITAFGGLATFLDTDVPNVFAAVADDALQTAFAAANAEAVRALNELSAWLDTLRATQTDAFAIGASCFSEMLWATERVDIPLAELARMGEAELRRNLDALGAACRAYAPGLDVRECVARVNANKPAVSPVEEARAQLSDLRAFIEQRDIVSIPGTEAALVAESPPHMRWNTAYISIPGPYERALPSTYYIAPPDPAWSAEERAAYIPGRADLLAVSVHEVWPGHFLHFLHANRARSRFAQVFVGYAFAEGWAHYAEEMVIEHGLGDGDPEVRIGQVLNALLRTVRFVAAIGLHTGRMTVTDVERLFTERAYQDAGNARQQAARGTFDPAYLNYTLGKLLIRELRDAWMSQRGPAARLREFHDTLLSFGGPPIPLVRRAMLGG